MSRCLLFCISEEAKAFVRDALDTGFFGEEPEDVRAGGATGIFYLVESREGPPKGQHLRKQLPDNETFETDFIGATPADCQRWMWERCSHDKAAIDSLVAILDARSAKDGTILMQIYIQPPAGTEDFTFGGYGVLPKETNTWYNFRVDRRHAGRVMAALTITSPDVIYPIYYGNKERFTDEHGVFDVQEADRYCMAVDPDVRESEIIQRKFWKPSATPYSIPSQL